MLEDLLGSINKERVLVYLLAREKGYATEIARFWKTSPSSIVRALEWLEAGGVLVEFDVGRARVYEYNSRYPLRNELSALVARALAFYPAELRNALEVYRRRPRRKGKPL